MALLAVVGNARSFARVVSAAKRLLAAGAANAPAQRLFAAAVERATIESGVDPSDLAESALRIAAQERLGVRPAKPKRAPKRKNPGGASWQGQTRAASGKYTISYGSEETFCDWCGRGLFVGDTAIMSPSGDVFCCQRCMTEARSSRANPSRRGVAPLAFEARDRYREDLRAGHVDAAEYWRGQAAALFAGDPRQDLVAGADSGGRVKSKKGAKPAGKRNPKRVKHNRTNSSTEVAPEKKRDFTLAEGRQRFEGFDAAKGVIEEFHGSAPTHLELYAIDDGKKEITVDRVHAALHRTLETNYMVPWENSNKHGTLWKHEHKEGKGLKGLERGKPLPNPEDLPLEIYDPATKTTRKIGGKFLIRDWWYS